MQYVGFVQFIHLKQVVAQVCDQGVRQQCATILVTLGGSNGNGSKIKIDVFDTQGNSFTNAHSCPVDQRRHQASRPCHSG